MGNTCPSCILKHTKHKMSQKIITAGLEFCLLNLQFQKYIFKNIYDTVTQNNDFCLRQVSTRLPGKILLWLHFSSVDLGCCPH